ncbi:hypothetical protein [Methanobrevibacter sp.]
MIFDNGEFKTYDEVSHEYVVVPVTTVPVTELLETWSRLITELSLKEIEHYKCRESYQALSDKIIESTDFKELYGKNNAEIRKNHVKNELAKEHEHIKNLSFSIDYLIRKISFLKQLIHTKTVMMEIKE